MARTLQDILDAEKPEIVARAKIKASEMLLNIHLAKLRERTELIQEDVVGVKPPTIKIGEDVKLSSLKKYIEATGGKLRLDVEMSDGSHYGFSV